MADTTVSRKRGRPKGQSPRSKAITDAMRILYEAGWTQKRIAEKFGVAHSAVCYRLLTSEGLGLPVGVTPVRGKFVAQRRIDGKTRYLGTYDTPEEAHQAYLNAGQSPSPEGPKHPSSPPVPRPLTTITTAVEHADQEAHR